MNPVEAFLYKLDTNERDIAYFFHSLLTEKFNLKAAIKWNVPTYSRNTLICYLNPDKKKGVHLCFMKGNQLSDPKKILDSKGRKLVQSYHLLSLEDTSLEVLLECINEAVLLD